MFFCIPLFNLAPPKDILIQNVKDGKVSGTEGQILVLICTAVGGKPPPEVKLTVSSVSVSVTGNQSIQYTNQQITRNFDRQIVTCTANHSGFSNVLKKTAMVYLNLKPLKPTFCQTSISTEETIPLTVSCTSEGSRPPASFQWYIGSTNVTAFAKDTSSHTQPSDTYTVHSTLAYHVNRSYNTKEVTCKVTNIADLIGTQDRKQLDVKYAPDITVNSPAYTQNDDTRTVTCNPSGNPNSYAYHKWQHRSKYGELIREFNGIKTLMLPDTQEVLRYQDSGEYICIASNGIKDNNTKLNRTGSGYLIVKAQPVFTSDTTDRVKQFGEIGRAVEIHVNVYSVPKFTSYIWDCDGKPITLKSAKYESSSTPTIVVDTIYGKEVQLDGYNVTLSIRDLEVEDFDNYTVTLKSGFADVRHTIILESASVPETPGNFSKTATSTSTITVQWDPNSGGGYKQTFYIQYRVQGLLEWKILIVGEEDINEPRRRRTYELRKLRERNVYELRMFAENTAMKRSNFTDVLIVFTDTAVSATSSAVIGPVVGVVVTLVIVCASFIVILLIKRSQGKDKKEKSMGDYEALGVQDKPSIYAEMKNQKEQKQLRKQQAGKKQFKKSNNPSENIEINTTQEPTEKVYENEVY
ncbi:unnamed protein product [Mytilus coruscus]|uniref:Uncharacterized protein n=1 Tax=Mytilus coruscus TaxID=42192 RepID=A0A6J8A2A8_MYTCO|nr:unnamed protein product [Mytilus coruscus]